MSFSGFPKDFTAFFRELKGNNEKAWFDAHKARYEASVVTPCLDFIEAMAKPMAKFAPQFSAIPKKVGGSMFRIYKDTRFSKDKTPYKTHAGLHFRHRLGKDAHAPGFYLHIEQGEVFYGGGMWRPEPMALTAIRTRISEKPKEWTKVIQNEAIKDVFGGLSEGDPLSRPPKGFDRDHPHIEDLKRRSFFVIKKGKVSDIYKAEFLTEVANTYKQATPLIKFLCEANDVPF